MNQITVRVNIRKKNRGSFDKLESMDNIADIITSINKWAEENNCTVGGGAAITPVGRSER